MNGVLYYNKSDQRVVNKTLELVSNIDVEFIEDSSIIDPILKLTPASNVIVANYIYLQDFHRYYYIKDVQVSKGYCICKCHVDVLMSFKDEIMLQDVILERQELEFDQYQDDPEYKLSQRVAVKTVKFNGSTFSDGAANYILIMAGDYDNSPSNT